METTKTINKTRKEWLEKNKNKLAEYARNYYYKRCEQDPNYRKLLCEREKTNKKKKQTENQIKRPVGRPRLYTEKII